MDGGHVIALELKKWGVQFVATLCGGHTSPILHACVAEGMRAIDVRDEATAAFFAMGVSVLTGRPGVCLVTAGPGVTNIVTPMRTAREAGIPLIAIGGASASFMRGKGSLQDTDQVSLARAAGAKAALRCVRRRDIPWMLSFAFCEAMRGTPGPVFIEFPVEMLYDETTADSKKEVGEFLRACGKAPVVGRALKAYYEWKLRGEWKMPSAGDMQTIRPHFAAKELSGRGRSKILRLLARSKKPVILLGGGAMWSPETLRLNEIILSLGIPTFASGLARGSLAPDNPFAFHSEARKAALKEADCVILAGVPPDFRIGYGMKFKPGAKIIRIDRDTRKFSGNLFFLRPLRLTADPAAALSRCAESGDMNPQWSSWLDQVKELDAKARAKLHVLAGAPSQGYENNDGANPGFLCRAVADRVASSKNSVVIMDGGDFVGVASKYVEPIGARRYLDAGPFGTLGAGAGFALAAKAVHPEADVWVLFGDGAFGWATPELFTAVKHNLPFVAVIGNDGCWTQIERSDRNHFPATAPVATQLGILSYEKMAHAARGSGIYISRDGEVCVGVAWADTVKQVSVAVLNVRIASTMPWREGSLSL